MKEIKKSVLAAMIAAAMLFSTLSTLLAVSLTSQGRAPEGYVPAGCISIADAQALLAAALPAGGLEGSVEEISEETGLEISRAVLEMESSYTPPAAPLASARDWSVYTTELAKNGMTSAESAYYDRLDALCRRYMDSEALDGVNYEACGCYATDCAVYSDLGLTFDQARAVAWWFKYNNPQYYFITPQILKSPEGSATEALWLCMYSFAADGEDRAAVTNRLFSKLDRWIESVNDDEVTTWQKELSANNLLCQKIVYSASDLEQSLYAAVVLERTVCSGYAQAFSAMMNASGIDTVVALGPGHAWNVVRFDDGNYYAVDVCWNDDKYNDDVPANNYFNVGEVTATKDDNEKESHTYRADTAAWTPVLSQNDYVPTHYDITGLEAAGAGLGTPGNFRVTKDLADSCSLAWDAVEGADRYEIALFRDAEYQRLWSSSFTGHTAVKYYELQPGTTYYYAVRAVKSIDGRDCCSGWAYLPHATPAANVPAAA